MARCSLALIKVLAVTMLLVASFALMASAEVVPREAGIIAATTGAAAALDQVGGMSCLRPAVVRRASLCAVTLLLLLTAQCRQFPIVRGFPAAPSACVCASAVVLTHQGGRIARPLLCKKVYKKCW